MFDFIVDELRRLEPEDVRRIRPLRIALQNQRDDLLAFAGVLDGKLAAIAQSQDIAGPLVREACVLRRLPSTSTAYWQGWNRLQAKLGRKFHALFEALSRTLTQTPRSIRWWRTSIRGCALTLRCAVIWAARICLCYSSS